MKLTRSNEIVGTPFILVFGLPNTGKSVFALTGDPRTLVIDIERKIADYANRAPVTKTQTTDFDIIEYNDIDGLIHDLDQADGDGLLDGKQYRTLVVDSGTRIWDDTQIEYDEQFKIRDGEIYADSLQLTEWKKIKGPHQRVYSRLRMCPMIRIVTAHAAETMEKNSRGVMVGTGIFKAKIEKSVYYDASIVLETFINENGVYCARVHRDNTNIFPVNKVIENPSYQLWSDFYSKGGKTSPAQSTIHPEKVIGKTSIDDRINACFKDPEVIEMLGILGASEEVAIESFKKHNGDLTVVKARLRELVAKKNA